MGKNASLAMELKRNHFRLKHCVLIFGRPEFDQTSKIIEKIMIFVIPVATGSECHAFWVRLWIHWFVKKTTDSMEKEKICFCISTIIDYFGNNKMMIRRHVCTFWLLRNRPFFFLLNKLLLRKPIICTVLLHTFLSLSLSLCFRPYSHRQFQRSTIDWGKFGCFWWLYI